MRNLLMKGCMTAGNHIFEEETDKLPDAWKHLRADLTEKVLELQDDCMDLSDEELFLLSEMYAGLFFFVDEKGIRIRERKCYQERLDELEDELDYRCRTTDGLGKQALLLGAVSDFSRIWPYFDEEFYKDLMQRFVKNVESAPEVDYTVLHMALHLLQLEPLTKCVFDEDACGCRRYEFSVGEDLFKSTLRSWAKTQNTDGSWTGVPADEAYGRIVIVGQDFGSMSEVDNYRLTLLGYNHYCTTPCHTPQELYDKYKAYSYKRRLSPAKLSVPIMQQTMTMLKSPKLTLEERLYLYNIVL